MIEDKGSRRLVVAIVVVLAVLLAGSLVGVFAQGGESVAGEAGPAATAGLDELAADRDADRDAELVDEPAVEPSTDQPSVGSVPDLDEDLSEREYLDAVADHGVTYGSDEDLLAVGYATCGMDLPSAIATAEAHGIAPGDAGAIAGAAAGSLCLGGGW